GSITHRGGRDARVPVRRRFAAIVGCADAIHQKNLAKDRLPSIAYTIVIYLLVYLQACAVAFVIAKQKSIFFVVV
ncbi:MAG: hypothetical protein LBQ66_11905, partial [Planctomycetaceae bacterium]|nr:hypothetical protein [Planctomycetaceae bacterium]